MLCHHRFGDALKSYDQTWLRYSGRSRTHGPSTARQGIAQQCSERDSARAALSLVVSLVLSALTSPQAFHRFVIHLLACISQQGSDPAIAISTVLARQFDHVLDQALFVSTPLWQPTLRGSVLAQNATGLSLRNFELVAHMINAGPRM